MNYDTRVDILPGIGDKTAIKLKKLGIETLLDLIWNFPRRYENFIDITPIAEISQKSKVLSPKSWNGSRDIFTIGGSILGIANKTTRRRGFVVTEGVVTDDTGTIKVVWFNQPYLSKMLQAGSYLILHGKVSYDPFAKTYVMESPNRAQKPMILPIYSETAGLSSYFVQKLFEKYKFLVSEIEEYLPEHLINHSGSAGTSCHSREGGNPGSLVEENSCMDPRAPLQSHIVGPEDDRRKGLLSIREALLNIHEPKNTSILVEAQKRFAFEELFLISLRANLTKSEMAKKRAQKINVNGLDVEKFIANLPFELTGDQKKATADILADISKDVPMNRLLNGDVGSGKTIVAAIAAFAVNKMGLKTLIMTPTSILANQHYETFKKVFSDYPIGLMTGSKKDVPEGANIIVGTHALIQKSVDLDSVGLVVVDEQHRFGVKQREALLQISGVSSQLSVSDSENRKLKAENLDKVYPHFLSMTATPIPRTLQLALFGDLDISVILEKPANRKEIKTRLVESWNRQKAYDFIGAHLKAGRQAFVICPLIEESQTANEADLFEEDRKSVKVEYEKLQKIFSDFKIGMLHGKMKAKEKDEIMGQFQNKEIDLLVSTSVVEVGVDIPNASVMMIEDAERFGLAQIHQFRGRVGRAEHQSFCFLFSNNQNEATLDRLRGLEEISDGFKLAELDLKLRGPGAIFGTEQSGILDLKFASFSDSSLIEQASLAAKEIAPEIDKYPKLKEKISSYFVNKHLE